MPTVPTEALVWETSIAGLVVLAVGANQYAPDADNTQVHFFNDGRTAILCQNTAVSAKDITVQRTAVVDGYSFPDLTYSALPASGVVMIGPFAKSVYDNSGDHHDTVIVVAHPSVLITPFRIPG